MSVTVRPIGDLLREWRQRRRLSQLELSLDAEISTRHLSFLETGRSQPSREMVLRLAEQLDVPLRERNLLLHAAGYASVFPERPLDDPALRIARAGGRSGARGTRALSRARGRSPLDAGRLERRDAARCSPASMPALLQPPVNVLRLALHPAGMAPRTANLGEWRAHLLARLGHQIQVSGDPVLIRLLRELRDYPAPDDAGARRGHRRLRRAVQADHRRRHARRSSAPRRCSARRSTSRCRNWRWRHSILPTRQPRMPCVRWQTETCHNLRSARSIPPTTLEGEKRWPYEDAACFAPLPRYSALLLAAVPPQARAAGNTVAE